jgi:hypothetical protein
MSILMRRINPNLIYPPNTYSCPDYWKTDSSGNCTMPTEKSFSNESVFLNSGGKSDLGKISTVAPYSNDSNFKTFDPNNILWSSSGKSSICSKKAWANQNNIIWDGISNYNKC